MESFRLGRQIMKGLPDLSFVALDENLMSEQLLCICVEYKKKFGLKKIPLHNIYTDSNVSVVSEMVQPLIVLQERVKCLLDEWPDHPGLQKILDITVNLLSLSLSTPPAKVLLGLQYLLGRSVMLEEYGSKFYLADQLRPIYVLVSILQKMELDCWPALLDRIQEQYEINAENLWFPLHSVLYRKISGDLNDDYTTTIQSLEEFIQTSNVGEFKRRLELLLAFHGQFKATVSLNTQSSCHVKGILKILYNISGYYVQLVPIILENIKAGRELIETDLRELFKFAQWQQPMFNYSSIETFRRFRQKFWKLINKFNDTLQQPINTETVLKWNKMPDLPEWKICNDKDVKSTPTLDHLSQFNPTERNSRFIDWRSKVESAYRGLCTEITSGGYFSHEPIHLFLKSISSGSALLVLQERWENGWDALETICRSATDCANLCKEQTSSLKKRRAISDLLKLLERCGLSKHGYILSEMDLMLKQQSGWFLQPSYDVRHLLLPKSSTSNHDVHHQKLVDNNCHTEWIEANAYYFKNLAMVQRIRQICLNFHKDLSLEQVNRINSFIDHLIRVQQGQRSAAYVFSEKLDKLRRLVSSLKGTGSDPDCSITLNQNATGKCMWKQKKILDCLYGMSRDLFLLLRTVGDSHLNDCNEVRIDVSSISIFIEGFTKKFLKSKESLDKYLLHNDAVMITTVVCTEPYPVLVSKNMEELIMQNFQIIEEFDKGIQVFVGQAFERSMKKRLLSCFDGIICQAKRLMEEFRETDCQSINICVETFAEADASFSRSFGTTKKLLLDSIKNIDMLSPDDASAEVLCPEKITSWNALLEFYMEKMQLDLIYDALSETIMAAGKLVNLSQDRRSEVCKRVELCFRDLCASLDMMLSLSDGLLIEFIALHKSVVKMAIMLAHLFASLFSEGFGNMEEQTDDTQSGRSHDAAGTGIGEGEGVKDVSEQIDDEDQILGTFEKTDEGPDANDKLPSQDDKGIEMNEDFAADTFSVSEDSDDGNSEDGEDVNLDSAMGELGDSGKAIDEKLCDGDEDEDGDPNNGSEKYETGPSVKEKDVHSEEFRAKEDMSGIEDEAGELDNGEAGKVNENSDEPDISNENENVEDMKMDKVNASEEPTGLQPNEQNQGSEDASTDEHENMETMDDVGPETDEDMVEDDKISPEDDDEIPEQVDTKVESNGGEEENTENVNMDIVENNRDRIEPRKSDPIGLRGGPGQSSDTMEPFNDPQSEDASLQHEAHWSNSSEMQNILASSTGLPSDDLPNLQINLPNTGSGGKLTSDQPEVKSSEQDVPVQRPRANPYRSIGDALADWDDKIKVSADSLEHKSEAVDEQDDEKGDEYKYVSTEEKSTSQALGPATSDQLNGNIKGDDLETDEGHNQQKDDQNQMDIEREDTPMQLTGSCMPSNFKQKTNDELQEMGGGIDASLNEVQEGEDQQMQLGDSVSIKNSYVNDSTVMLHNMVIDDQMMETVVKIEEISNDMKTDAMVRWKRYEQITTRLSQELSEQLRLVMEPTLANKLQGDYKTGKRINMKKVIPYIASHYRKDKIWLRRTRPNKRDYQVVIAIDDSRSMSESHCGEVAIEALVTVCRAMSQLEVGQFAVSSFGEGGNIQLLHDFDQPFNGEAGANMISRLTFRKENTIIDEPVVHLLKFLNDMLDGAVARSRLPSGQNPLQQLVLIIADGRFHEKEKLKRYVRDVLNRKRMIAFILLDSPQESIMELMEATFKDEGLSFSRYLDSFPFPYYIVLRNIEALPRTLADLLRQWFELMQSTSD
ncbi:hypothetical protein QJS10_CPB12g01737 [Acorus calamus]|uniref:VWFA domain-containing protein n=1 Tax=Acorus calamus TaxID=4465 RepID=A0AAV9DLA2_ACOCL|nr:hypothetical protein QJS10_CPB12g01737 [Acorus calamus]